jgi:undecaprenyl-diphosphatase
MPVLRRVPGLDAWLVESSNALVSHVPGAPDAVGLAARWLAGLEVGLMLLLAARGRPRAMLRMLLAVSLVYVACDALALAWQRARPFETLSGVLQLAAHTPGRSFPSRHVASAVAMALLAPADRGRLAHVMLGVGWLLGVSRVAAGLHYPSDVAAGAILGTVVARVIGRAG